MGYTMDQQKSVFEIKKEDFRALLDKWIEDTTTNPQGHRVSMDTLSD